MKQLDSLSRYSFLLIGNLILVACGGGGGNDDTGGAPDPVDGTIEGIVQSPTNPNPTPLPDTTVEAVASSPDNTSPADPVASTQTGSDGSFSLNLPPNQEYDLTFSGTTESGATFTETVSNVAVGNGTLDVLQPVFPVPAQTYQGSAIITGQVIDAAQQIRTAVAGVTVNCRAGINNRTGSVIAASDTSDDNGYFQTTALTSGNYTCEFSKFEFGNEYASNFIAVTIAVPDAGTTDTIDLNTVALSKKLSTEKVRIVLTWAGVPLDLDAHLTGPNGNNGLFHVYFQQHSDVSTICNAAGATVCLDRDRRSAPEDVAAGLPETITILEQKPGTYRYWVHNFQERSDPSGNSTISQTGTGVRVELYINGELNRAFYPPPGGDGTLWEVFTLNGSTVTPVNDLRYESNEGDNQSTKTPNP